MSFLVILSAPLYAQTPGAAPVTPQQTAHAHDTPLNPNLPTLFIVGDSTARNNADLGWGDHLAPIFDTTRINIANRAIAGRSSRSYIAEGHWADVLAEINPGDTVLIQMGHNDGAGTPESVRDDAKRRTSLKGDGDETTEVPIAKPYAAGPFAHKPTETVHTYGWNIRKMIDDAKAKGAFPMVMTPTVRNIWKPCSTGTGDCIERDMGFRDLDKKIAAEEHVPLIDMATLAADTFEAMGQTQTATFFPVDHTHTSAAGAEINARCVARALSLAHVSVAAFETGHDQSTHP